MDIVREKKKVSLFKKYWPWFLALIPVGFAVNYLLYLGQADFVVDSDGMMFGEVRRGAFSVSVRGTGVLVPDDIQWLASHVDARVETVIVKPGKFVKQGELIVQLNNPQLEQQLEETKWELEALEAETLAQKVSQESGLLDQQSVTLNAKLNFEASQLKMAAQQKLFNNKSGAVSQIDFEQTQLETKQFKQRWQLQQARFEKMQENLTAQNNARAARLNKMRKILERVQQQVAELAVRASIDSVVQALPLEPGQQISMGTNIAKLARKNSLIAELQIPEIQIRDVAIGQRVEIDTRNNKVDGVVTRIDPAVINGNVQVDVAFRQELPRDARPDLTVDGEIKIAEIDDALHVNRPLFAQSQSSSAVYKLDKNGEFAERVFVKLGKGSTNQIQVIEGLSAGDKIIISDPTSWETYQKIKLN
ncbi:MAG: HlyD family efflux transporter periplasmic adaptor subunit [Kangiellaceae bacterium]|nr:HlyD family efflux transporter periplasmic adaptor subunit [Kangiellaceae bacterium]